jgi:hypothetical protein
MRLPDWVRNPGKGLVFVIAAGIAGCSGGEAPRAETAARMGANFSPDANGLSVEGTGLRVDFGRAPSGVIAALDRELGPGRSLALDGCSTAISQQIAWGALVLTFSKDRFVGWREAGNSSGQVCNAAA